MRQTVDVFMSGLLALLLPWVACDKIPWFCTTSTECGACQVCRSGSCRPTTSSCDPSPASVSYRDNGPTLPDAAFFVKDLPAEGSTDQHLCKNPHSSTATHRVEPEDFQCKLFQLKAIGDELVITRGTTQATFALETCSASWPMDYDDTFNSTLVSKYVCLEGTWIHRTPDFDENLKKIELIRIVSEEDGIEKTEYREAAASYLNCVAPLEARFGTLHSSELAVMQMDEGFVLKFFTEGENIKREKGFSSDFETCVSNQPGKLFLPSHNVYLLRQNQKMLLGKLYITPEQQIVAFIMRQ